MSKKSGKIIWIQVSLLSKRLPLTSFKTRQWLFFQNCLHGEISFGTPGRSFALPVSQSAGTVLSEWSVC